MQEVTEVLDSYRLDEQEKAEMVDLIDQTLHHHTLNIIFNLLPTEKHPEFIAQFKDKPHDKALLDFLKKEIHEDVEAEIKKQAERVKKEILQEISKAKKR